MNYLILSACVYVMGGVAMTKSLGFTRLFPSILLFVFFGIAATLQTLGMKAQQLGVSYVLVLGLEAVFAGVVGVAWLEEPLNWTKFLGTALVVSGIVLLKTQGNSAP